MSNHAVRFFDAQFQRQAAGGEFELNPFERLALPYLKGEVLDLGCGLGNLALAAAVAGWEVLVHGHDAFPAPGDTLKVFDTVIARRPAGRS